MVIKRDEWESIYKELLPKVFNYFRYRLNDGYVAEELTSTTFEKAWKARRKYKKNKGGFTTWIFTIARNTGTDYLRRQEERVRIDFGIIKSNPSSIEEIYEKGEDISQLLDVLSGLDKREREIISLKYGAEFTNRKIAEISGLSETNVGTILHRSKGKLREEWEEVNAKSR